MKTRLLTLLLSVVLAVGCVPLSSSAVDVYHLADDTQLVDMGTSTVLAAPDPILYQSLASISPLSTTTETYWSSSDISNALKYLQNISSYTSKLGDTNTWLNAISTRIATTNNSLSTVERYLEAVYKFVGGGANPWWHSLNGGILNLRSDIQAVKASVDGIGTGSLADKLSSIITYQSGIKSSVDGIASWPVEEKLSAIQANLGFPENMSFYDGDRNNPFWDSYAITVRNGDESFYEPVTWYRSFNQLLASLSNQSFGSIDVLSFNGNDFSCGWNLSLLEENAFAHRGLASILRGPSWSSISGSILTNDYFESGTQPDTIDSNNLLSAFRPLFPIQNDLARLTFVQADPTTIELKKSQQGNEQAVRDNFTGDKGVNPDDIGSMSGMGDSLGSFTDTGVTMDDGFTQLNNGSTWNFFSQEVASQLNNAPATYAEDEDFVHFYDPENKAFQELLERVRGGK